MNRHWIVEQGVLFENIKLSRYADPVKLEYMEELFDNMCKKSIKAGFMKRKEEFVHIPVGDWLESLKDARNEAEVADVESVEAFIEKFTADHRVAGVQKVD